MKEKVIYQIYPKSYFDTNNDGIGDFEGIRQKLLYLKELGIDMIWLNPFYPSPQKDNGYDISNYKEVDPCFGTLEEFQQLLLEGKKLGIEFMLDMVLNHVSTEHEWFQKALSGEQYYQDFFILREKPTDWVSKFGGSAWAKFGDTSLYYLHLFDLSQADLNWQNPNVRKELYDVVNFWRNLGVKGFRFDVINVIGKDKVLKNNARNEGKEEYTDKPITHVYLQEMSKATYGQDTSCITVGEMSSTTIENCIHYTQPHRKELHMTFNFHHLKVDYKDGNKWTQTPFDFEELKTLLHTWGEEMSTSNGWNALFWNNHDQPRALNRFIDVKNFRVAGAKMLAAAIHLNRGTPFIYMGEEIGMIDPCFETLRDYQDIESMNAYQSLLETGHSEAEALKIIATKSRDNSRVPMQWSDEEHAGFSKGTPWLKVGKSYTEINVASERSHGTIFKFYQQLIRLRKELPVISKGTYTAFDRKHQQIYGFIREYDGEKLLVLCNFSNETARINLTEEFSNGNMLISNYPQNTFTENLSLQPYQVLAILR